MLICCGEPGNSDRQGASSPLRIIQYNPPSSTVPLPCLPCKPRKVAKVSALRGKGLLGWQKDVSHILVLVLPRTHHVTSRKCLPSPAQSSASSEMGSCNHFLFLPAPSPRLTLALTVHKDKEDNWQYKLSLLLCQTLPSALTWAGPQDSPGGRAIRRGRGLRVSRALPADPVEQDLDLVPVGEIPLSRG